MNRTEILKAVGNELVKGITEEENEHLTRLERRRITPESIIPHRRFLFRLFGKPCFPRGELVAVTGRAKSGKTFVTSILMTLAVCREVLGIRREEDQRLRVLWMDTEQSEESTQEILCERIMKLWQRSGAQDEICDNFPSDMFDIFNVRADFWQNRLPMLEAAIEHYRPDLVILDGIRDLVNDINDGVLSQEIIERLMHLASDGECCIVSILHQNKASEDKNLRGWIGTELTYKSFEVYECSKDTDRIFSVKQTMTRKYDIDEVLQFVVDAEGLPTEATGRANAGAIAKSANTANSTIQATTTNYDAEEVFTSVMQEGEKIRGYELQKRVMQKYNTITLNSYLYMKDMAQRIGLLYKTIVNPRCVYYTLQPTLTAAISATTPNAAPTEQAVLPP
jgi:KaiC/GvpD/RAD55 family RecA-like ATPase